MFLNKTDADPETAEIVRPDLERDGWEVLQGSAVSGEGLEELRRRMAQLVQQVRRERADRPTEVTARPVLRPAPAQRGGRDFTGERPGAGWRWRGAGVSRGVDITHGATAAALRYHPAGGAGAGD